MPLILEDNEHGAVLQRFSKKAQVRIATEAELEEGQPLLRNKDGRAVLALHGWDRFSDTSDIIRQLA